MSDWNKDEMIGNHREYAELEGTNLRLVHTVAPAITAAGRDRVMGGSRKVLSFCSLA